MQLAAKSTEAGWEMAKMVNGEFDRAYITDSLSEGTASALNGLLVRYPMGTKFLMTIVIEEAGE